MSSKLLGLFLLLLTTVVVACGQQPDATPPAETLPSTEPPQPAPEQPTESAATAVPPTLPPPPTADPNAVLGLAPEQIGLDLQGLAQSFEWSIGEAQPPDAEPGSQGFPRRIVITFDGQERGDALAGNGPYLYIFPIDEYVLQHALRGNSAVAGQVNLLRELTGSAAGRGEAVPDGLMPLLPYGLADMDRWAQFRDLQGNGGQGVRFLADNPNRTVAGPWTNATNAYYYQGFSPDRRFYISLFWPVRTDALPEIGAEAPPDVQARAYNVDTYPEYLAETKAALNELPPTAFTPSLEELDTLVASLTLPE